MHRLTYIVVGGGTLKNNEKVIIANTRDDSLSIMDLTDWRKTETWNLKESIQLNKGINMQGIYLGPYELECDKEGNLYCTNVYDNSILKIRLEKKEIVDILAVGKHPTCIKYFENKLFIVNSDSNSISVVDVESFSLVENIQVGEKPIDIEIDEVNKRLYVANFYGQSIDVINLISHEKVSIKLNSNPVKMIIDNEQLFILTNINNGNSNTSNISILDLKEHRINDIKDIKGIFNNMLKISGREIVFITNMDNGYLYRMDIERRDLLSKTYLSGMPNKLGWNGKDLLIITNISKNSLTLFDINLNKVIGNIEVGSEPNGILILN